ncbi:Adenylate cyclase, partial [Operophtera brumata]
MVFCISILSKRLNVQDSAIGILAGVSRIAASCMFAFAPTREWFYVAPVLNIFSHTGLTAVRSIATKCVPTEEVVYMPASSFIYMNTIKTFPGAFYMFDATLTVLALGLFTCIAPSVYMPASSFIYMNIIKTFPGAFYMFDATLTVLALGLFTAFSVHACIQLYVHEHHKTFPGAFYMFDATLTVLALGLF